MGLGRSPQCLLVALLDAGTGRILPVCTLPVSYSFLFTFLAVVSMDCSFSPSFLVSVVWTVTLVSTIAWSIMVWSKNENYTPDILISFYLLFVLLFGLFAMLGAYSIRRHYVISSLPKIKQARCPTNQKGSTCFHCHLIATAAYYCFASTPLAWREYFWSRLKY